MSYEMFTNKKVCKFIALRAHLQHLETRVKRLRDEIDQSFLELDEYAKEPVMQLLEQGKI